MDFMNDLFGSEINMLKACGKVLILLTPNNPNRFGLSQKRKSRSFALRRTYLS